MSFTYDINPIFHPVFCMHTLYLNSVIVIIISQYLPLFLNIVKFMIVVYLYFSVDVITIIYNNYCVTSK